MGGVPVGFDWRESAGNGQAADSKWGRCVRALVCDGQGVLARNGGLEGEAF
jgi:hypothetical protein